MEFDFLLVGEDRRVNNSRQSPPQLVFLYQRRYQQRPTKKWRSMMVVLPPRPPEQHDDDNEEQSPPQIVDETKRAIKDWVLGAAGVTRKDDKNSNKNDHALPAAESAAADSPRRYERAHPQRRSNNNTTSSVKKDNATKNMIAPAWKMPSCRENKEQEPDNKARTMFRLLPSMEEEILQSTHHIPHATPPPKAATTLSITVVRMTMETGIITMVLSTPTKKLMMIPTTFKAPMTPHCRLTFPNISWMSLNWNRSIRDKIQFERIVLPKHRIIDIQEKEHCMSIYWFETKFRRSCMNSRSIIGLI